MTPVNAIFSNIQSLNATKMAVSSIGTFVDDDAKARQENTLDEVVRNIIDKNSLAYKIATTSTRFSEKQLWVIAFELAKNTEYANGMLSEINANREYAEIQKSKRSEKRAKAKARVSTAAEIKANATDTGMPGYTHPDFGFGTLIMESSTTLTLDFGGVKKCLLKTSCAPVNQ